MTPFEATALNPGNRIVYAKGTANEAFGEVCGRTDQTTDFRWEDDGSVTTIHNNDMQDVDRA